MKRSLKTPSESASPTRSIKTEQQLYQDYIPVHMAAPQSHQKTDTGTNRETSASPKKKIKTENTPNFEDNANTKISGEWDAEKREKFMDEIIALGYKSADLDEMAERLGLNKRQLINQLTLGRNNFRSKAVAAVKEG